jgi:hypothetical protein
MITLVEYESMQIKKLEEFQMLTTLIGRDASTTAIRVRTTSLASGRQTSNPFVRTGFAAAGQFVRIFDPAPGRFWYVSIL